MKKIPIILSTLTLATAGSVPVAPVVALGEAVAEASSGQELFIAARLAAERVNPSLKTNYFDERVRVDAIIPRTGNLIVDAHVAEEGQAIRKIAVATASYDRVSMAQADEDWLNWDGATLPDWNLRGRILTIDVAQKDYRESISVDYKGRTYDLVENNRQDVVYFYAELGGWDGSEPEVVRGKIDYRTCAKNVDFPAAGSAMCEKVVSTETGETKYLYQGNADPKLSFATWEEEFKSILRGDIGRLDKSVQELEQATVIKVDTAIISYEAEAQKLRTRIYEAADPEELAAEIKGIEDRLADLRKKHFSETSPEESTGDGDKTGNEEKNEGDTDDNTNTKPTTGTSGVETDGNSGAEAEGDSGVGSGIIEVKPIETPEQLPTELPNETEIESATTPEKRPDDRDNKELNVDKPNSGEDWVQNQVASGITSSAEMPPADNNMPESNDEDNKVAADENKSTTSEAVEIPNLGGGEEANLWPWIIMILSVAGASGWWLWRAFGRKVSRK